MFKRRQDGRSGRIDTLVGKGVQIQGDVGFVGGLHLDGSVTGTVSAELASEATLSVSQTGRISGSLMAPNVLLDGTVQGDIVASGRVALGPHARVEGDVLYGSIEIAAGAEVRGRLVPHTRSDAGRAAAPGHQDGGAADQWSRVSDIPQQISE